MSEDERTLFVAGFNDDRVSEELLYELFLQAGPLERVTIPKDKGGIPRKFAFVTFQHDVSVPYAMEIMDGVSLFGRTLSLKHRGGGGKESPRNNSPASSPHGYNRSNTWHGSDSNPSPNPAPFSPPTMIPNLMNPYGPIINAASVLRGQSFTGSYDLQSMQPRVQDSIDNRRQRVLDQQQMALASQQGHADRTMHRSNDRHNGAGSHHDRDSYNRSYRPYGREQDRRRRY